MTIPRRRPVAALLALPLSLALSLPLLGTGAAHADSPAAAPPATSAGQLTAPGLALPRPTGPFPVGRDTLHLTDTDRRDPWAPQAAPRELMVSMYYPARPVGGRTARYMTPQEAAALVEQQAWDDVTPAALSTTTTYARTGAPPLDGRFPLVVLSPGFGIPRTMLTLLAVDLASRGYVVAAVDHAYESVGTAFPGGRLLTCLACTKAESVGYETVSTGRARDVSFLLDRLLAHRPAWRRASLIDPARIGMAGHSIGGAATISAMKADARIRAGIAMDGSLIDPVPAAGLGHRPFLLLGADPATGEDPTWSGNWDRLDGWKRWLTVTGFDHYSFTDWPVLAAQTGPGHPDTALPGPGHPDSALPGERAAQITRAYTAAFFDLHLKGHPQPLLDGPTPGYPEVMTHRR